MTDLPDKAVEAAARALCELDGGNPDDRAQEWVDGHFTAEVSDPAWTAYVEQAIAALTAAAPHIAAQATADLRAGIEALRDEWRVTGLSSKEHRMSRFTYTECADALDALLREGE